LIYIKNTLEKNNIEVLPLFTDYKLIIDMSLDYHSYSIRINDTNNIDDDICNEIDKFIEYLKHSKCNTVTFCPIPSEIFEPYLAVTRIDESNKYAVSCAYMVDMRLRDAFLQLIYLNCYNKINE